MTTAEPKITIRTESDFVDLVPIMLGFVPKESLVMIFLKSSRSASRPVDLVARMDIRSTQIELARTLDAIQNHLGDNQLVLIAYSADSQVATSCLDRLQQEQRGQVLAVIAVVGDDRFVIDGDGRLHAACESEPDRISAEAVLAGIPLPLADRAALADTIRPPSAENAHAADAEITSIVAAGDSLGSIDMITWFAEHGRNGWPIPSRQQILTLVGSIQDMDVRDAAWVSIRTAEAHRHLELWRQAALLVDGPVALPVLGLLAMAGWIAGQGALANLVMDRARATEGFEDYSMFGLLGEVLQQGVNPTCWENLRPTPAELGEG